MYQPNATIVEANGRRRGRILGFSAAVDQRSTDGALTTPSFRCGSVDTMLSIASRPSNELPNQTSCPGRRFLRVNLLTGLLEGGAANAAKQLHQGLDQQGVDVRLWYPAKLKTPSQPCGFLPARWNLSLAERITETVRFRLHRQSFRPKVRHRPAGMEIFTSPRGAPLTRWPPSTTGRSRPDTSDQEIIHLHWVAKFIDYRSFFGSLSGKQIVIWTLHDMNPFTGGCHFTEGCEQFISGCGNCPQLPNRGPQDISHEFFQIKRDALRDVNLHIVTASRWMRERAERSPIFEHVRSYHRIPYGLPLSRCQPVDRAQARAELGLDPNAFVFAFGAVDIRNRRKGTALLLQALEQVADVPNAIGLVLGGGNLPEVTTPLPPLKSMGFVSEMERRILIYSACDLFVLPSTEDNMPLTGLEALASGTPIVAFDAGGLPDFVRPNVTGLLAPVGDSVELGNQIRYLAEHREQAQAMGNRAREIAVAEYSDEREAKDYVQLYAELLDGAGTSN